LKRLKGAQRELRKALKLEVEPCPFTGEYSELLADSVRLVREAIVEVECKFID
jgi:hypothetical protein